MTSPSGEKRKQASLFSPEKQHGLPISKLYPSDPWLFAVNFRSVDIIIKHKHELYLFSNYVQFLPIESLPISNLNSLPFVNYKTNVGSLLAY